MGKLYSERRGKFGEHKSEATELCMSIGRVPPGAKADSLCSYSVGLSSGGPTVWVQLGALRRPCYFLLRLLS